MTYNVFSATLNLTQFTQSIEKRGPHQSRGLNISTVRLKTLNKNLSLQKPHFEMFWFQMLCFVFDECPVCALSFSFDELYILYFSFGGLVPTSLL